VRIPRKLRGGDPLGPSIRTAIDTAAGFAVLVSPKALESKWVLAELRHAIQVQRARRGAKAPGWLERLTAGFVKRRAPDRPLPAPDPYPIVPLALDGTRLGALEAELGYEPIYIRLDGRPGGIESALNAILVALHRRAPADRLPDPRPDRSKNWSWN